MGRAYLVYLSESFRCRYPWEVTFLCTVILSVHWYSTFRSANISCFLNDYSNENARHLVIQLLSGFTIPAKYLIQSLSSLFPETAKNLFRTPTLVYIYVATAGV